jgi:pimeloyl-ACP methyl ester carboxylesterase
MPFLRTSDLAVYYLDQGSGTPVIFLHGNWATSSWWEPLLARLPDGWRGIACDLRGRGRTTGPDSDYSIPSLATDLRAFIETLGLEAPHLVGHSLGSGVAMEYALQHPSQVRSLTVLAPAWVDGMPQDAVAAERQRALKADRALFALALKAVAPTVPDDAYWQRLVAEGHAQRLTAALAAVDALASWKPGDRLRSLPCPKLVIGGARDLLILPAVVTRAAEALGASCVMLPEVGHSPNLEAPEAVMELLITQLRHQSGQFSVPPSG